MESIEDIIRRVVRDEIRRELGPLRDQLKGMASVPAQGDRRWLKTQQAADRVGHHRVTIHKALLSGTLHGVQPSKSGRWRIEPRCVDAWLEGVTCPHDFPPSTAARRRIT